MQIFLKKETSINLQKRSSSNNFNLKNHNKYINQCSTIVSHVSEEETTDEGKEGVEEAGFHGSLYGRAFAEVADEG